MSQQVQEHLVREPRTGRWQDDGPLALVAAGVAAATWLVLTQAFSVDLAVRAGSGTQHVNVISVIVTAVVVTLVGGALKRLLERRTPSGRRTWTVIALAVAVVSLVGPLGARTAAVGLGLALLHGVVAVVVIGGLRRRGADRVA